MHRPEPNPPRRASLVPSLLALALFAALLAPSLAQGRCMSGNLTVWPPPETALPTSPLILIEGFGDQQPQVAALAADGSAELVAPGHRVALVVDAVNVGAFRVTQAVVHAAEPLKPSKRYVLKLRGAKGRAVATTYYGDKGREKIGWKTASAEPAPLQMSDALRIIGPSYVALGCGPSVNFQVAVPATSGAPIAVEVALTEADASAHRYVVPIEEGVLRIGHGMCGGPFEVTGADKKWQAKLTLRDAAGRVLPVAAALEFAGVEPDSAGGPER
ncbi:MAG: hypothetical protein KC620_06305 [Myxococcales bacterium]|nr:hypothetical protein [Myxococcales bacterium]